MSDETPKQPTSGRPGQRRPVSSTAKPAKKDPASNDKEGKGKSKGNAAKGVLIGIVIILLLINAGQLLFFQQKTTEHETKIEEKNDSLRAYQIQLDSLHNEVRNKISQITALQGDTTELNQLLKEIDAEREKFKNERNYFAGQVSKWKGKVNGYKELLDQKDAEIEKLRQQVVLLDSSARKLKTDLQTKEDSISSLAGVKEELEGKVEEAQILTAGNFNYAAFKSNGKALKQIQPFKGRSIDRMSINFELMPNKVAVVETKTVYLQILDPSGNIINVDESGTFDTHDSVQTYYTLSKEELYQREGTNVSFTFNNTADYEEGKYRVNAYVEGHLIGTSSFEIK